VVTIKGLCRRANVEKVDAGPKGIVIAFRDAEVRQSGGPRPLWIAGQGSLAKVRPDQKIVSHARLAET
jgi:transcription-repair coupling factor (superfamily II helicase)